MTPPDDHLSVKLALQPHFRRTSSMGIDIAWSTPRCLVKAFWVVDLYWNSTARDGNRVIFEIGRVGAGQDTNAWYVWRLAAILLNSHEVRQTLAG